MNAIARATVAFYGRLYLLALGGARAAGVPERELVAEVVGLTMSAGVLLEARVL